MSLWITNHLIPSSAQGNLSYIQQRNIYPKNVTYNPNSRLPILNVLACAELEIAMDEARGAAYPPGQWGQPPPCDQR